MTEIVDKIKEISSADGSLTYDQAKKLAADNDPVVRRQLARYSNVQPEVLYFLADDADPLVRIEIARNENTPQLADDLLVGDANPDVRGHLALKIAKLAPGLSKDERNEVFQHSISILEKLARDQIIKVRQVIANTLKDVANAPHDIIKQLAMDAESLVATPILELSPVLTDEDLLEIIKSSPASNSLTAISGRSSVAESVSEAIVGTNDKKAVTALLANSSAQIREETLDGLIEQSRNVNAWQEPLVRRPKLSSKAAVKLAGFVADNLLRIIEDRADLDPNTIRALKFEVQRRIDNEAGNGSVLDDIKNLVDQEKSGAGDGKPTEEFNISLRSAKRLLRSGKLKASDIQDALAKNDRSFVISALAVRSAMPLRVVEKIIESKDADSLTALTWKADLPMALSSKLQASIAGISAGKTLHPDDDGGFPLAEEDMSATLDKLMTED